MIGIISDIHGNYTALKEVLQELDKMQVEEIYCLGDVVGYYSQINECIDELRKRNIKCVMGNHDWYMVSNTNCPRSKSVNDCLEYQRRIIRKDNLDWLGTFPLYRKVNDIFMLHGGWDNPIDEYVSPSKEYFMNMEGRMFLSGHTHLQVMNDYGSKVYCNPGSVGQPRDNDPRAAFAVLRDNIFELHRVAYDVEIVGKLMLEAGFNDYYFGCLYTGAKKLCRYEC